MKLKNILQTFEKRIPLSLQESWDHSGLNLGSREANVTGVYFAYDVCLEVLAAARRKKCQLIVSHHPFRMQADVRLDLDSYEGRLIATCIQNGIALYSAHTNHDNSADSLNFHYLKELGLKDIRPLKPLGSDLFKLAVFVPCPHVERVLEALFAAGAGGIGNYSECSFRVAGLGTFKGDKTTHPTIGKPGLRATVAEERIEVMVARDRLPAVIAQLQQSHPYEEPAYDLFLLARQRDDIGLGASGVWDKAVPEKELLRRLKKLFKTDVIRWVSAGHKNYRRVGICTGSGMSLYSTARATGCDLFITGDVKYHQAIDAKREDVAIADVGHFHSEIASVRLLKDIFKKLFGDALTLELDTGLRDAFDYRA